MDFFATPITNNPNATSETLVKQRVNWAKGLKGCFAPDFADKVRNARIGKNLDKETRAKISATHKAKSPVKQQGPIRLSEESRQALSKKMQERYSRPVMTYYGVFPSRRAVAEAAGVSTAMVGKWMKLYPEHYYFLETA